MKTGLLIGEILTLVIGVLSILAGLAYVAFRRGQAVSMAAVGSAIGALVVGIGWLVVRSEEVVTVSPDALSWVTAAAYLSLAAFLIVALEACVVGELMIARQGRHMPDALRAMIAAAGIVVAGLIILRLVLDINVVALVALPTVATAVIGVALKDTLARFFAGLALGKMIKVGDWISTLDKEGCVTHIGMEHVTLATREHDYVILPNDNVIQAGIVNYSRPTRTHSCWIDVDAAYRVPPTQVIPVLVEAAMAVEGVAATPPPGALVSDFKESGIQYRLIFSIEDYARHARIESQVRAYVWNAFHRQGIEIPFPQRVVHRDPFLASPSESESSNEQLAGRLGAIELFSCLSFEQLAQLAGNSTVQKYLQGERIVRQGDEGEDLYVILDGRAEVSLQHEGLKKQVGTLEPGQYFGEMSLLTGERRLASVAALTDLEVLAVGHKAIKKVLQEDKTLVEKIGAIMARRLSVTQAAQDELSREYANRGLAPQQKSIVERIQNYLWGRVKR